MKVVLEEDFSLEIDDRRLDDYELVEALTDVDKGKVSRLTDAVNILLGEEKPTLFEHIREKKGYVSTEEIKSTLMRIIAELKNGKKY
ncbi:MAG: hypothetical protein IJ600_03510 [Lachnospiraceae bacterium]|nr:hypothetical protein [Lachnospiraceae bacterium]